MHEKKAEVLAKLHEASRGLDDALRQTIDVARNPQQHGLFSSIGAAIVGLPLLGVSALAIAVGEAGVASTPDADWQRDFPDKQPPVDDAHTA